VIVQTADPDMYRPYIDDYEKFIRDELVFLQKAGYPPFAAIARILISDKNDTTASSITLDTVTRLKEFNDIEIVGQGKAPIERIAGKYRYQILLRSQTKLPLLRALHTIKSRKVEIDMDAVEFG